jgi:hypothetical protein
MTTVSIKTHLHAAPFAPFEIVTSSGNRHAVKHPDFVAFSPSGETCLVFADDGEFFTTVSVQNLTEIRPLKRSSSRRKS